MTSDIWSFITWILNSLASVNHLSSSKTRDVVPQQAMPCPKLKKLCSKSSPGSRISELSHQHKRSQGRKPRDRRIMLCPPILVVQLHALATVRIRITVIIILESEQTQSCRGLEPQSYWTKRPLADDSTMYGCLGDPTSQLATYENKKIQEYAINSL